MIDALTLDQMRIFVAAVDEGSFSAAARKLGRVQSAVSQSIAALEGQLGVALFDRSGKTPRLTPAGVALAKDARRAPRGRGRAASDARRASRPRSSRNSCSRWTRFFRTSR